MADIRDEIYSGTGETFEQTFKRASKGSYEYSEALKELAELLARINSLSEEQKNQLKGWLENLDDINDRWESINDYIEDSFDIFEDFYDDLKGVRSVFTDIVKDLTSARQRGTETVTLFRNLRDISGDLERSLSVQNGFAESNLSNIQKRAQKAREVYEFGIKDLTNGRLDKETMEEAARKTEDRLGSLRESLRMQRSLAESAVHRRGGSGDKIKKAGRAAELAWYKVHGDEVRKLTGDLERLNYQNYEHVKTLDEQSTKYKKLGQEIRQHSKGLGFMAKVLEKAGVAGAKEDYEDYVQSQANAALGKGPAKSQADVIKGWVTAANLYTIALLGAAAAVRAIWKALKDVSVEASNLQRNIGKFDVSMSAANTKFATAVDWLKTANELASQFYINPVSLFDPNEIAALAEAKNMLGLSSEQMGTLGARAKMAGQTFESYEKSIDAGIHAGQAANKTALSHGLVMKDILSTTDATALSMGNNVTQISKAAVAARALGMDLQGVQKIAESLLNFESSIEAEMSAQLLTGQQMNLSRARGLALQNDLEGVAKEIGKHGLTVAEFNKMNFIQQSKYAEALGMSRDELAKMVIQQDLSGKVTDEMRKKALRVTTEELKSLDITQQWKTATEKLAQAFTPLLKIVTAIITPISNIIVHVSGWIGKMGTLGQILTIIGLIGVASFTRIMATGRSTIASLLGGVGRLAKAFKLNGVGGTIGSRIRGAFGGKAGSTVTSAAGAGSKAKGTGSGLKQLGKNMAGFFTAWKKVTVGDIGKATLGTLALIPTIAVAPGIAILAGTGLISQKGLPALGKGLAGFFRALKTTTLKSIGIATAATVPVVLLTAVAPGIAILAGAGLLAGKALPALGKGLAGFFKALGSIPPPMLLFASLAVAVITGALIGIGFALKLAAPAIEAVGNMIKSVLEGIGTVIEKAAIGFGQLAEAVKGMSFEDIGKLALLGPTLLALGGSLLLATPGLLLGGIGLWVFTRRIKKLSNAGKGIPTLASGMRTLAEAVGELKASMSGLDTSKINDLAAASMKAMAVKGLSTVFRGIGKALGVSGGDSEIASANVRTQRAQAARQTQTDEQAATAQVNTAKIENLLTVIANRLNEGYDVYLDADKVGRTLAVRTV